MSHKDTLELYDELVAGGCTEAQARVQAKQLASVGDNLANALNRIDDKFTGALERIDKRLIAIDKDLFWMRIIGGSMTLAFLSNGISSWFK